MEHKDTEQKYDLYTEKIVLSPKVKYKNLIRTIKILILIITAKLHIFFSRRSEPIIIIRFCPIVLIMNLLRIY